MMVTGGRRWRARVAGCAGVLGVLAFFALSGCGSRTSMLDNEGFSGDGSPLTNGGSTSVGSGGSHASAGKANPGKAGTGGVDESKSEVTCKNYCAGFAPLCPARLNGQDCFEACQWEVNSFGAKCQTLGIKTLQCLTPFFRAASPGGCEPAVGRALQECGDEVNAFEKCKPPSSRPNPTPTPNPGPMPTPTPTPTPMPDPTPTPGACPGSGEGGNGYCKMTFQCAEGPYTISCNDVGGATQCWCYTPYGGQWQTMSPGASLDVCQQGFTVCGFGR